MIRADGSRLFPAESTGVHGSVAALVLLSAAGHVGVVLWALSGEPSHELAAQAGSVAVVEVTLVSGPARGSPGETGRPAPESAVETPETSVSQPAAVEPVAAYAAPDHATSAERSSALAAPVRDESAMQLPPAIEAPPVPPRKPDRPAKVPAVSAQPPATAAASTGVATSTLPSAQVASVNSDNDRAASAPSASAGSNGGNRGAAPRADNPAPSYPASARRRGQEGRVILRVEVLPNGDAGDVALEKSSGIASLDRAALKAVRRWRFVPASKNGRSVAATVRVPIRFALK
jgi:protein TonB